MIKPVVPSADKDIFPCFVPGMNASKQEGKYRKTMTFPGYGRIPLLKIPTISLL
jgi:hypothetical protein